MVYYIVTIIYIIVDIVHAIVYPIIRGNAMIEENTVKDLETKATEELKRQVKSMIVAKGFTMEKLANELNAKYGTKESKANISNKLSRGSLRYIDMQRICEVLGYSIEIK